MEQRIIIRETFYLHTVWILQRFYKGCILSIFQAKPWVWGIILIIKQDFYDIAVYISLSLMDGNLILITLDERIQYVILWALSSYIFYLYIKHVRILACFFSNWWNQRANYCYKFVAMSNLQYHMILFCYNFDLPEMSKCNQNLERVEDQLWMH